MTKKAVIFYGAPGAGKGTQAEMFAADKGYVHFDSGKYIEAKIRDPKFAGDPMVTKQRKLFLSGKLCDPKWIGGIVKDHIEKLVDHHEGLVFSGSPRTEREAFGARGDIGVIPFLEDKYGKEDILVFLLEIPVAESVERNSKRGREGLDEPAVIRVRCREYKKLTLPILKELRKRRIKVVRLDGMPSPKAVHREVMKRFKEFSASKIKTKK
ncbi:MAG: nucleoside monophosphate kinase [Candidatus Colwellbacteria bacterium]|nr:nucleoside monophosphate kinase [Candidatus Colwellbacteria bacterium]